MSEHYMVVFKVKNIEYYTIWFTNDICGFIIESNTIKYFNNKDDLGKYCDDKGLSYDNDDDYYDVDKLLICINEKNKIIDCEFILNFWNIISDISKSINIPFVGDNDDFNDIYHKLFYGNNLPSINTSNKKYVPNWSLCELNQLYVVMENGSKIIKEVFKN
jgi:hypothetical protein